MDEINGVEKERAAHLKEPKLDPYPAQEWAFWCVRNTCLYIEVEACLYVPFQPVNEESRLFKLEREKQGPNPRVGGGPRCLTPG